MAITFDAVALAAQQIVQTGDNPTIEKIRMHLGSTGSNTTISKHLHVWRRQSAAITQEKNEAPNVVQAVVESAWHQLREQADAEIEKIREESRQQIEIAQKQTIGALEEREKQNQEHTALQESWHAVSAEKEILTLDLRKLHEQHNLLNERHDSLNARYADMQDMTTHQFKMATEAHQNEIARLEQSIKQLKEAQQKLVDEIREQSKNEHHRQVMVIENLKAETLNQEKHIAELQAKIQEDTSRMAELALQLKAVIMERDNAMQKLQAHEKQWQIFNDKILVSPDIAKKLDTMPELEKSINLLNQNLMNGIHSGLSALKNEISHLIRTMETQDD